MKDQSSQTVPSWPTYPDGRPLKMGEMTREQQKEQWERAAQRLKAEMESQEFQKAFDAMGKESEKA